MQDDEKVRVSLLAELRKNGYVGLSEALESLLRDYPVEHRREVVARLGDDDQVMDTFLELATYRLLHFAGHKVKTIHPDLSAKGLKNNPDFLVELANEGEAIVEVTCGSPSSQKIKDQGDQTTRMLEGLRNELGAGDWSFQMWFRAEKAAAFSYRKLSAEITGQVASKSQHEIEQGFEFEWMHLTIRLKESRKPIPGGHGGVQVLACGWLHDEIQALPSVDRLRRVLEQKAKHYGPVAQPFILVVGLDGAFGVDEEEILDALIGRRQLILERRADGTDVTSMGREADGFFGVPEKAKYTRISGVLFVGNWHMTTLAAHFHDRSLPYPASWGLYVTNPFAGCPVLNPFPALPRLMLVSAAGQGWVAQDRRDGLPLLPYLFNETPENRCQ